MWADKLPKCALPGGPFCNDNICKRADCLAGHWRLRFQSPSCLQPSKKATAGAVRGSLFPYPASFAFVQPKSLLLSCYHLLGDCFYTTVISGHNPITRLLKVLVFSLPPRPPSVPPTTTHHYHIQSCGSQVFPNITGLTQEARLTLILHGQLRDCYRMILSIFHRADHHVPCLGIELETPGSWVDARPLTHTGWAVVFVHARARGCVFFSLWA